MSDAVAPVPEGPAGLSRRQVLGGAAAAALAAAAGLSFTEPGRALVESLPFFSEPRARLQRTPLNDRLGQRFTTVTATGDKVRLTLASIGDLPEGNVVDNAEGQFIARFEGPATTPLEQGTYTFSTAAFGEVALFIVPAPPIGSAVTAGTVAYDAVFNQRAADALLAGGGS